MPVGKWRAQHKGCQVGLDVVDGGLTREIGRLAAENERLQLIERAARAYDEFILRHGVLEIERSQRLSAESYLLHKAMHETLSR